MKLVVAIDGEQSAKIALAHILKEKYASDTQIHLVHVIVPGFADAPVDGIPDVVALERKEEQAVLEQMATALKESLNIDATTDVLTGETADVIAEACKRFDADECIVPVTLVMDSAVSGLAAWQMRLLMPHRPPSSYSRCRKAKHQALGRGG